MPSFLWIHDFRRGDHQSQERDPGYLLQDACASFSHGPHFAAFDFFVVDPGSKTGVQPGGFLPLIGQAQLMQKLMQLTPEQISRLPGAWKLVFRGLRGVQDDLFKNRYLKWGALASDNMEQNLWFFGGLILIHTHLTRCPSSRPGLPKWLRLSGGFLRQNTKMG